MILVLGRYASVARQNHDPEKRGEIGRTIAGIGDRS